MYVSIQTMYYEDIKELLRLYTRICNVLHYLDHSDKSFRANANEGSKSSLTSVNRLPKNHLVLKLAE